MTLIDADQLVLCLCGCGQAVNDRQLRAQRMRGQGATVDDIADEFGVSQSTASKWLEQAANGRWASRLKGHAGGVPKPSKRKRAHLEHSWRPKGYETLGGVQFLIEVCSHEGCEERRARRPTRGQARLVVTN